MKTRIARIGTKGLIALVLLGCGPAGAVNVTNYPLTNDFSAGEWFLLSAPGQRTNFNLPGSYVGKKSELDTKVTAVQVGTQIALSNLVNASQVALQIAASNLVTAAQVASQIGASNLVTAAQVAAQIGASNLVTAAQVATQIGASNLVGQAQMSAWLGTSNYLTGAAVIGVAGVAYGTNTGNGITIDASRTYQVFSTNASFTVAGFSGLAATNQYVLSQTVSNAAASAITWNGPPTAFYFGTASTNALSIPAGKEAVVSFWVVPNIRTNICNVVQQ